MATDLWLGRVLFVLALVLFCLSGTSQADHFLTHPAANSAPRDAKVYLTPRNIPKNDQYLKAYDADKAAKNNSIAAPGLLGIANQTYRGQVRPAPNQKAYSLADAMRDAVWRKKTAAKLKTLTTSRPSGCVGKSAGIESAPALPFGLAGKC